MAKKKHPLPSMEEIEQRMKEWLPDCPGIETYQWTDENGNLCRSHKIKAGNLTINTGDAGLELFLKELKKQANYHNRSDQI